MCAKGLRGLGKAIRSHLGAGSSASAETSTPAGTPIASASAPSAGSAPKPVIPLVPVAPAAASSSRAAGASSSSGMTRRAFATAAALSVAGVVVPAALADDAASDADAAADASASDAADPDASDAAATDTPVVEPEDLATEDADAEGAEDTAEEDDATSTLTTIDEDGNVHIINTFTDIIDETTFEPVATYVLPIGCTVYCDCDSRAIAIQANPGSQPFTLVGCLDFSANTYTTVVANPLTGDAYAPSEARATDQLIAWVEIDNATDAWAFYAAPFSGQPVTSLTSGLVKLGEGDAEWLPPQFAVYSNAVVWQVMPDPSGSHTMEYSHAYLWTLGASTATEVWESPGRFACAPSISSGVLTIAPRVNADEGVYYGITAIDLMSGLKQVDQHVLPTSVKPFYATRTGDNFAFSIEANYGYGGLMGTMGYYIGPGDGPFKYVAREPSAQVSYVNGYHIVKSRLMYFVIDLERETYARIGSASQAVDYGDYPATSGSARRFVTYTAVEDASTGIPNSVLVRIFSLL